MDEHGQRRGAVIQAIWAALDVLVEACVPTEARDSEFERLTRKLRLHFTEQEPLGEDEYARTLQRMQASLSALMSATKRAPRADHFGRLIYGCYLSAFADPSAAYEQGLKLAARSQAIRTGVTEDEVLSRMIALVHRSTAAGHQILGTLPDQEST